jgi:acetyl-CoA synthetase
MKYGRESDHRLTGDLGVQDEDGYFWYVSRECDVITTAGYRVGPSGIEHALMKHPAVAMSAVVGIPDPVCTESIKAWIVLRPGFTGDEALAREIQEFVKVRLAAHEYPRFVEFVETLPMTATGKVLRRAPSRMRKSEAFRRSVSIGQAGRSPKRRASASSAVGF